MMSIDNLTTPQQVWYASREIVDIAKTKHASLKSELHDFEFSCYDLVSLDEQRILRFCFITYYNTNMNCRILYNGEITTHRIAINIIFAS